MIYVGSKSRIGAEIAKIINQESGTCYVEPFMGALQVAKYVTIEPKILADLHPELAGLYHRAFTGQDFAPKTNHITREEYYEIKSAGPSHPHYAFVGFAVSFRGKWWGGYARAQSKIRPDGTKWSSSNNPVTNGVKSIMNCKMNCGKATFLCSSYLDLEIPNGSIIYCDPPYKGTQGYTGTPKFNSEEFWIWAEEKSKTNRVFVSELTAPEGWRVIWEKPIANKLGTAKANQEIQTEKLYTIG